MEKNTGFVLISQEYKDSSYEIGKRLKILFGLHFVCPSDVDYLHENYLTPHSKFPPEMRAEIQSNNKRTNNVVESFNLHSFGYQCSNRCCLLAAYHLKASLALGRLQMSGS